MTAYIGELNILDNQQSVWIAKTVTSKLTSSKWETVFSKAVPSAYHLDSA